jgi:hypothetical protein
MASDSFDIWRISNSFIVGKTNFLTILRRNKTNEMHIQSEVNRIFSISMLLRHVSALYELHLQGAQRILMKLCVYYFISAELIEGREWIPSVCCQSVGSGYRLCVVSR